MQNSVLFYQRLFCKTLLCWVADHHSPWVDSFTWTRSNTALSDGALGKLTQCSSINRLYLPGLAATASESVHRQYATAYSPWALSTPAHHSKSASFYPALAKFLFSLARDIRHKLLLWSLGSVLPQALWMFTFKREDSVGVIPPGLRSELHPRAHKGMWF